MSAIHRRGPWSNAEDSLLMQLVQSHGPLNWVRIAQTLGSRTPKQCRERYHQNLKPSLNHEPITAEEGVAIERLVHELGKRWAEIARRLNGRSDNAVKNWWNGSQNRRKRLDRRRTAQSTATYEDRYQRAAMPMAPSQSPLAHHQPSLSPPSWHDMPLPSPCSSELTDSDAGSNYTTSPARTTRSLQPSMELPPLRAWPPANGADAQLPSLSSLASPSSCESRTDTHGRIAPRTTHGQLLTAPSSPVQPPETDPYCQRQYGQLNQPRRGSVDRDSRMDLSSLLI